MAPSLAPGSTPDGGKKEPPARGVPSSSSTPKSGFGSLGYSNAGTTRTRLFPRKSRRGISAKLGWELDRHAARRGAEVEEAEGIDEGSRLGVGVDDPHLVQGGLHGEVGPGEVPAL